jgi:hypothetical protein
VPERLDAIEDRLLATGVATRSTGAKRRWHRTDDLELAHDRMHVAALRGLRENCAEQIEAGGSDCCHRSRHRDEPHTWDAVLRAPAPPSPPPTR